MTTGIAYLLRELTDKTAMIVDLLNENRALAEQREAMVEVLTDKQKEKLGLS